MLIRTPDYVGIYTQNEKHYFPFTAPLRQDDISVDITLHREKGVHLFSAAMSSGIWRRGLCI